MNEKFDWKTTQNTSRSQQEQGLDTNIRRFFCNDFDRMDLLSFIKPLNVILTKRFVLINQNRNF